MENWFIEWRDTNSNKLRAIKDDIMPWPTASRRSRREEIILCRLRIGHTRLTHRHLMERNQPTYCDDCLVPVTVVHMLAECPSCIDTRYQIFQETRNTDVNETMKIILSERPNTKFNVNRLVLFLRACNFLDKI